MSVEKKQRKLYKQQTAVCTECFVFGKIKTAGINGKCWNFKFSKDHNQQ